MGNAKLFFSAPVDGQPSRVGHRWEKVPAGEQPGEPYITHQDPYFTHQDPYISHGVPYITPRLRIPINNVHFTHQDPYISHKVPRRARARKRASERESVRVCARGCVIMMICML